MRLLMIYRKTLIPSILYLSFAILVQPVSASSPAEKDLMDGYVRDGLHCEANANFLGAIHAYTNATDNNPKDRCAWVRLAKAYRASDQFYKGWLAQYESRQNEQAAEHSLFYVRPAIVYTQEYTPHSG